MIKKCLLFPFLLIVLFFTNCLSAETDEWDYIFTMNYTPTLTAQATVCSLENITTLNFSTNLLVDEMIGKKPVFWKRSIEIFFKAYVASRFQAIIHEVGGHYPAALENGSENVSVHIGLSYFHDTVTRHFPDPNLNKDGEIKITTHGLNMNNLAADKMIENIMKGERTGINEVLWYVANQVEFVRYFFLSKLPEKEFTEENYYETSKLNDIEKYTILLAGNNVSKRKKIFQDYENGVIWSFPGLIASLYLGTNYFLTGKTVTMPRLLFNTNIELNPAGVLFAAKVFYKFPNCIVSARGAFGKDRIEDEKMYSFEAEVIDFSVSKRIKASIMLGYSDTIDSSWTGGAGLDYYISKEVSFGIEGVGGNGYSRLDFKDGSPWFNVSINAIVRY